MRKFFALITAAVFVVALASGAFAVEYGGTGYETEGYDEDHAWEISSAATLVKVRDDINKNYGSVRAGSCFKFTSDIDLTGAAYENWQAINIRREQDFTFDGNNHTVKLRIVINGGDFIDAGLFGNIEKGTIKNLSVTGSIRSNAGWGNRAGGIAAGIQSGTISNCNFDGTIANTSQYGFSNAGGIAGVAGKEGVVKITNCKVGANSDTAISSYGFGVAGGIVGTFHDNNTSNRITGNYARVTLESDDETGMIYGARDGINGTVSGNTEVNPEGDDDDSGDNTNEDEDRISNNDSDNTNGNNSNSGGSTPGNNNSNPGQDSGGDNSTDTNTGSNNNTGNDPNGTNGNTGNDTSQNSTNTGETVNNPQAQSSINVGTGGGGGCNTGLGLLGLMLALTLLRRK